MKKILFILSFTLITMQAIFAQMAVDRLRLSYDEKKATAKQIGMTVTMDGKTAAFAYDNGVIKILDLVAGRIKKVFNSKSNNLFEARFNYDGSKLILIEEIGSIIPIDIINGKEMPRLSFPNEASRVSVHPNKDVVAVGMKGGGVYIFDLSSNSLISEIAGSGKFHVSGLDFNESGNLLAVAAVGEDLTIYNTQTWSEYQRVKQKGTYTGIKFSGNTLVVSLYKSSVVKGYLTYGLAGSNVSMYEYDLNTRKFDKLFKKMNYAYLYVRAGQTAFTDILKNGNNILTVTNDKSFSVVNALSESRIYTTKSDNYIYAQKKKELGIEVKRIYPLYDGKSFLINYSDDNINEIYNSQTKNITAFIYSDSDEKIVVASRDGRMDGGATQIAKVYWTQKNSNAKTPLESTFDQFYTPGLLPQILGGSFAFKSDDELIKALDFAPTVTISSPDSISTTSQRELNIQLSAIENGDPFKEFKVFVNDKMVSTDTRGFKIAGTTASITISLLPGENRIKAVGVSASGYQSIPDQAIVTYAGQQVASNLYVLAVGINEYKNPRYNLNYALADAEAFTDYLRSNGDGIFKNIEIIFLTDDQAIKSTIVEKFKEISSIAQPQDAFVFYYAGHGVMSEGSADAQSDFFLALADITQMYGRLDVLNDKGISALELRDFCANISAQKQLIVLDACQSGGAVETFSMRGAAEEKAILQLARSAGTVLLASTGSEQFASEFKELGHGVFTYSLLEGFSGKADGGSKDQKITVKELESYLNDRIPELTELHKGTVQYPMSWSRGQDFPMVIVK